MEPEYDGGKDLWNISFKTGVKVCDSEHRDCDEVIYVG